MAIPAGKQWSYFDNAVGGWRVEKGEVGLGSIYNKRWGNTKVIELDAEQNQVYTYNFDLKQGGNYELNLDYAAR